MLRGGRRPPDHPDQPGGSTTFEPHELTGFFATPQWLRDFGISAWLAVGVTLLIAGIVWLLSLTSTIVLPVITAAVIAAVAGPLVAGLERHGVKRGLGTAIVLVSAIVLTLGVIVLILAGITS